jgi:hypothetical protein
MIIGGGVQDNINESDEAADASFELSTPSFGTDSGDLWEDSESAADDGPRLS